MKAQIQSIINSDADSNSVTFLEHHEQEGSTFEELVERGFRAKNKTDSSWTPAEVKQLKQACVDILAKKTTGPQVKDTAYYVSHYIFHGSKSKIEVEGMINKQIRHYCREEKLDLFSF